MPLYDFKCEGCGTVEERLVSYEEREKQRCKCGHPMRVDWSRGFNYIPFKEGWYEHITDKPLYIRSKRELREACEKHGCESVYLMDS